jgi:hypothetical protein
MALSAQWHTAKTMESFRLGKVFVSQCLFI